MEISGQIQDPAILPPRKQPMVLMERKLSVPQILKKMRVL